MTTRRAPRRQGSFRRGPRRKVEWFDNIINETVASGGQQVEDLSSEMTSLEKKGATVLRILVDMAALLIASGNGGVLTVGICIVDDDALASLTLPDPASETDKPGWLWRTRKSVFNNAVQDMSQQAFFIADLKAKRTFRGPSENLVMILDLGTSSASVNVDGWVRVLIGKN